MKKLFLIFLILVAFANAQQVNVIKDAPTSIRFGEILEVKISINNPETFEKSYEIIETIPRGFALIEPSQPDKIEQHNALSVMVYQWKIKINPQKIFTLNYKIKPNEVGEYTILPTKMTDLSSNLVFLSESRQFTVLCLPNNRCEENENSVNCAEDCGSGINDGICDYESDGKCDPDCDEEPDCKNIGSNLYLFIIELIKDYYSYAIFIVLILIIFLVIKKIKKIRKEKKLLKEFSQTDTKTYKDL